MGRNASSLRADSQHGLELLLRYLGAAWADCVVSVHTGGCAIFLRLARSASMSDETEEKSVGYKRPPKSGRFKKGQSGNPGGRRNKSGPIKVDLDSIYTEVFSVKMAGQTREMSAKEVEIRNILKRAIDRKEFKSIAYLLDLFEKHDCVAQPVNTRSGTLTLPTNSMPFRMAMLIAERYGFPENWTKRHIAWGRKQFKATMTEQERQLEAEGVIP
jgi:uncharacterized protein DUF5681